tara:strand:- start:2721 stop:3089 length:369 start_codon:yes stop_codon:yes gene_type:complete
VTQKAIAKDQRRLDMAQAFVEIGAVLFRDRAQHARRQLALHLWRQRIHVAVDRVGHPPQRQQLHRAPVGCHHLPRRGQSRRQDLLVDLSAADQQHRRIVLNNFNFHGRLMTVWETDHNPVMK